jgi:hypothetical protein
MVTVPMGTMLGVTMRFLNSLLPVLVALPAVASAATVEVVGELGVGRSDNIARVTDGEQGETITSVGLQLSVLHQSRRLSADITGDVAWLDYSSQVYDAGLVGSVGMALKLALVDDYLSWSVDDGFGQAQRDLYTAETPENQENINSFSTGPNLQLGFGGAMHLVAQARYAFVAYEKSSLDSRRISGLLGLGRELSDTGRVGLNFSSERVEAGGDALHFPSYSRSEVYLQYRARGARTTASLDFGGSYLSQPARNGSGLLVRFDLLRQVGLSTISFKGGREYTDSGDLLQQGGSGPLPAANQSSYSLAQTADPFVSEHVEFRWTIEGRRTSLGLAASLFDENYVGGGSLDRQRNSLGVSASRDIGPRVRANANFGFTKNDFKASAGDNDETSATLGLSWQVGRRLSLEFSGRRAEFSSDIVGLGSKETRYWLRVSYGDRITRR